MAGIIEDDEYLKDRVNKLNINEYITFLGPYSPKEAPLFIKWLMRM